MRPPVVHARARRGAGARRRHIVRRHLLDRCRSRARANPSRWNRWNTLLRGNRPQQLRHPRRRQRILRLPAARKRRNRIVEQVERACDLGPLLQPVEPRQVGEQQAAVEPPPPRHLLAVIEHRFLHPVDGAVRQRGLRMGPRGEQRRIPQPREHGGSPARPIGRLRRDPRDPARHADIAEQLQRLEEFPLRPRGKDGVARGVGVSPLANPRAGGDLSRQARVLDIVNIAPGGAPTRPARSALHWIGDRITDWITGLASGEPGKVGMIDDVRRYVGTGKVHGSLLREWEGTGLSRR